MLRDSPGSETSGPMGVILGGVKTIEKSMKIIDFSSPEGHLGAQICFQEARKLREKELEGPESELREKKNQKKRE